MNLIKQLNALSAQLTELLENMEHTLDYIDNDELFSEIDNNVKSQLENALTHLDIAIDDVADGMYENDPIDQEDEDWD
jgi:tRNA U34 5-carboxymethylaminomethyl modifying GTPase MnmE/TrmE